MAGGAETTDGSRHIFYLDFFFLGVFIFHFPSISNSGCAAGSGDAIEEWTVFNRSEAHFSTPSSSDKNVIRSNHMDMPHYSMNTISHDASFTHKELAALRQI